jgi:polar amino acid transport system substrate-binding protein
MTLDRVLRRAVLATLVLLWQVAGAVAGDWSTIRIGTEAANRPFTYLDASGQLQGLEIEIVRAMCDRSHAKCDFVTIQFDGLIPALLDGKIDAIASGLRMSEKRRKVIDFADKYYTGYSRFVTCTGQDFPNTSPAGLKGKSIGTQGGIPTDEFLKTTYKESDIRLYKSTDDAYSDLAAQRIDLVLLGEASSYEFMQSDAGKSCRFASERLKGPLFGLGVGMGLRKADTDLRDKLNGALKQVMADGTYEAIVKKYFPFSIY